MHKTGVVGYNIVSLQLSGYQDMPKLRRRVGCHPSRSLRDVPISGSNVPRPDETPSERTMSRYNGVTSRIYARIDLGPV